MRPSEVAGWRTHAAVAGLAAIVAGGLAAGGLSLARGPEDEGVRSAACSDPAGDHREVGIGTAPAEPLPGTDIREVSLRADAERLTVRFAAADHIPRDARELEGELAAPIQWVVWLMDGAEPDYHLRAILRADGWELLRDDLRQAPVASAEAPRIDGRELAWSVALEDLPNLPAEFGWVAVTAHGDPTVQDVCPQAAADSLDSDAQLRFPDPH